MLPVIVALLAGLSLTTDAQARPGTPNGGHTGTCGDHLTQAPRLCVEFQNTATEPVGFLLDWTEDGRPVPSSLRGRAECRYGAAQAYSCRALKDWFFGDSSIPGEKSGRWIKTRELPEGLLVTDLAYDTEYCFRFRAVDQDGVISGSWSGFTCARTAPEPAQPPAPARPQLTPFAPSTGRGQIGPEVPFKILVEWDTPRETLPIGWYSVERFVNSAWIAEPPYQRSARTFEAMIELPAGTDPDKRHAFRVCAQNVLHKSCSPDARTLGRIAPPRETTTAEVYRERTRVPVPHGTEGTSREGRSSSRASSGAPAGPVTVSADAIDALAAKGAEIAAGNTLFTQLRQQPADPAHGRGVEVGLAAAERDTLWGPGKQAILDALPANQRDGFRAAVSITLDRNRNLDLATIGASIAETDQELMTARITDPDPRFWLGFDIATGLFGNPALGSRGSTATGPGSLGIRDGLSAPAQRGFNASVTLHFSRRY